MGKTLLSRAIAGAALLAALAFGGAAARAGSIGINFTGGNVFGTPSPLAATDVAGVVPQANWNNADNNVGTVNNLVNQAGVATGASVSYSSANTWGSGTGTSTPNNTLYNGYLDDGDGGSVVVSVSGLSSAGLTNYKVLVYYGGDQPNTGRTGAYVIGSNTQIGQDTGFAGTFIRDSTGTGGNYVQFDNVSGDSFTLTTFPASAFPRAPVNGVQIVGIPEPASVTLLGCGLFAMFGYGLRRKKTAGA